MNVPPDPPRRRPGGGRKPGLYEPVTIVSLSMPPELLRLIDTAAAQARRSRSSFCRWVLRARCSELQQERDDRPSDYNRSYVLPEHMSAEAEADAYVASLPPLEDPTHGGRFDPSLIGVGTWTCATCSAEDPTLNAKVVSGWLNCPGCKTPRGDAAIVPYPEDA